MQPANQVHDSSLVGRSWEVDTLVSKIEMVRYGHSNIVTLEGDAGIGKTRLMNEVRDRSCTLGMHETIWQAAAHPQSELQPLSVLRNLRTMRGETLLPAQREVDGQRDEVALASMLTREIEQTCAAEGRSRLVLLVEDGHWMDSASAAVLRRLVLQAPLATCVVVSARRGFAEESEALSSLLNLRETTRVKLDALSAASIESIIQSLDLDVPLTREWLSWCRRHARGNPLHARALARTASEELKGLRTSPDGFEDSSRLDASELLTEENMIARRLRQFPTADLRVLAAGAVLQASFDSYSLGSLLDVTTESIDAAMLRAYRSGVVEREVDGTWRFAHVLLPSLVLECVDAEFRQHLHLQRAEQLREDESTSKVELASELQLAGDSRGAVENFIQAAWDASELGATREAAALFRRAERVASSKEERNLLVQGDVRFLRIRTLFAVSEYEEAAPLLLDELRLRRRRRTRMLVNRLTSRINPEEEGEKLLDVTRSIALLWRHNAEIGFFRNRLSQVLNSNVRALVEAALTGERTGRGLTGIHMGFVTTILGLSPLTESLVRRSSFDVRESWDVAGLVEHSLITNIIRSHQGQFEQVEAGTSVALEWFADYDDPLRYEMILALRAVAHFFRGDFDSAKRWHTQCFRSARSSGNLQATVWALSTIVYCRLVKGEPCEDEVSDLLAQLQQSMPASDQIYAHGALALHAQCSGDSSRWEDVEQRILTDPVGPYFQLIPVDFCFDYLLSSARKEANEQRRLDWLSRARTLFVRTLPNMLSAPPARAILLLWLAELLNAYGHDAVAARTAKYAQEKAESFGMEVVALLAQAANPHLSAEHKATLARDLSIGHNAQLLASRVVGPK